MLYEFKQAAHEILVYGFNNNHKAIEIKSITAFTNDQEQIDIIIKPINTVIPSHTESLPICSIELRPTFYDSVMSPFIQWLAYWSHFLT